MKFYINFQKWDKIRYSNQVDIFTNFKTLLSILFKLFHVSKNQMS